MIVLGIETSCDETAASVVTEDRRILSNVVFSQFADHAPHGGVVPEIAARAHLNAINIVVDAAIKQAGLTFNDLSGIAATAGPGLIGGVMVGLMTGKSLAAHLNIPFIGVNHLEGHALSPRLSDNIPFPYLLLLVSGGHTQILLARGVGDYEVIGKTMDDAAGECFDKSAKLLGLPQPGGPNLETLASECTDRASAVTRFDLPRPLLGKPGCDFSFSGLKTAMRERIADLTTDGVIQKSDAAALAAALEDRMAQTLADRCKRALEKVQVNALVVAGGVAANKAIRTALQKTASDAGVQFAAPPSALCTDNGAMIAWAGIERLALGQRDSFDVPARPRWPLDEKPAKVSA
ncbi:MAG TPA: tRNA (adenosine(37)-N6)-threonylcarbamoyltransferase complex transferase subunit TsaD [Alphaproteobacteria bacterium]